MEDLQVSVVIPSYNSEKTIRQAVESALSQEGVTLEVIVVDDGSRIPASEVLSDLLADTRLRILRREENLGVAAARNHGLINAAGKYVALLDSDDWWEQGKLAEQVEALERNKAVLCSTARELMSHDGVSLGRIISVRKHITYKELLKHNSIACSSVVVRRDVARIFPMEHDDGQSTERTSCCGEHRCQCDVTEESVSDRHCRTGVKAEPAKPEDETTHDC